MAFAHEGQGLLGIGQRIGDMGERGAGGHPEEALAMDGEE
jgi:hypothetical protein